MIDRLISFALRQRLLIIVAVILLAALGSYAFKKLPIDAFPDVTNIQVQIITETPGRSPVEVEKLITYPIEVQMTGLPRMQELRSLSKVGLSMVTVVFEDDVDIYVARQLILERLIEAKEKLPEGVEPAMGPISTGLGEVYQYTLEKTTPHLNPLPLRGEETESMNPIHRGEETLLSPHLQGEGQGGDGVEKELMELRTVQDWIVRPILKTVPGVADVNSFGGYVKQYQALIDPDRLRKNGVTLKDVFEAVSENNANAGGNIIEHSSEQYIVRGAGLIASLQDVSDIVVKEHEGTPGFVRVVAGVRAKVDEINRSNILPDGIKIKPFYDRTELVEKCIDTVTKALEEGA